MFSLLLKKQFKELFKSYFVDQKTGKARSKKTIILYILLFGFVMLSLAFMFFAMEMEIGDLFLNTELEWLYFALVGIITIAIGTFGSVLTTSSLLYQAKDNDFLLSLPIKPIYILLSRIGVVYGMSFIYGATAWLPSIVNYAINKGDVLPIICQLLLTFVVALLVSSLTCILGFIVAYVSSKIKNKSIIRVLLTLILLGAYYAICFNTSSILNTITNNSENISVIIKSWGRLIYYLGNASMGDILSLVLFLLITIVLFGICLYILVRSFMSIVTKTQTVKASKHKNVKNEVLSIEKSLLKREVKRFFSSSLYVLNCGLGIVFAIAAGVIFVINANKIFLALEEMEVPIEFISQYAPLAIAGITGMLLGMDAISTPSMSLEGNSIWILKTLPIDPYKIFVAKQKIHLLVNGIGGIISVILLSIALRLNIFDIICVLLYSLSFLALTGAFGLMIGTLKVNLTWTSEVYPIKQSVNLLYSMLFGFVIVAGSAALCIALRNIISVSITLLLLTVLFIIFIYLINKWFMTKGTKLFNEF